MISLSPRKQRIAQMVAESATNKQIAAAVGIGERRVEDHLAGIARIWRLDRSRNLRVQIANRYHSQRRTVEVAV